MFYLQILHFLIILHVMIHIIYKLLIRVFRVRGREESLAGMYSVGVVDDGRRWVQGERIGSVGGSGLEEASKIPLDPHPIIIHHANPIHVL